MLNVKRSVGEFVNFFAQTAAQRTSAGQRQSIQENTYAAHAYVRATEPLAAVIVTDLEYSGRVAHSLLTKILDEFTAKVPRTTWEPRANDARRNAAAGAKPQALVESYSKELQAYVTKYQDPKQADTIMRVQQELDETKIILHKTIESVLERGEKLDSLVDKSAALSASSKGFYKTAKKQNSFVASPAVARTRD